MRGARPPADFATATPPHDTCKMHARNRNPANRAFEHPAADSAGKNKTNGPALRARRRLRLAAAQAQVREAAAREKEKDQLQARAIDVLKQTKAQEARGLLVELEKQRAAQTATKAALGSSEERLLDAEDERELLRRRVKELEDVGTWLVDRAEHGAARIGQLA